MEQLGGEPPAWAHGAPCVVSCLYKPPSASAVVHVRGLKLGRVKLWPETVEPVLPYTRGCPDNVIVMISSEEWIGYHLYWGHLSVRHLALFLVKMWVATDDRRCCSLMSRASEFCRYCATVNKWGLSHWTFKTCFWCLLARDCYLILTDIDAGWTSAIFIPHKCKFVFPELFLRKQWFAAKSPPNLTLFLVKEYRVYESITVRSCLYPLIL